MENYRDYIEKALTNEEDCDALSQFKRETLNQMTERVQSIRNTGMKDEQVLFHLIREEFSNLSDRYHNFAKQGKMERSTLGMRGQKMKSELWDKMHYMFRNFNDRMVHAEFHYDLEIDLEALKTVIICLFEKAPVLHSGFSGSPINPYWRVADYHIDDVVTAVHVEADKLDEAVNSFLIQQIPLESPIQMKAAVFYCDGKSVLCVMENHMCMDGGDFKYFLKALCKSYNDYVEKGISPLKLRTGSRSYDRIYAAFSEEDAHTARNLYKNVCAKKTHKFPLTPDSKDDHAFIVRLKIDSERTRRIKEVGKAHGATVNDMLLTAFFNSMYELCELPDSEDIVIPCAIDLRRHLSSLHGIGLTNHTAYMQCYVPNRGRDIFEMLDNVINSVKGFKADKFMGLYGLPLLNMAYSLMPYCIAEKLIKIGYSNPLISISNMGVLDSDKLSLAGNKPTDGYITGAIKYKPYSVLTVTTLNGELTMTMCVRGNDMDRKIVDRFFDLYEQSLNLLIGAAEDERTIVS